MIGVQYKMKFHIKQNKNKKIKYHINKDKTINNSLKILG